MKLSYIFLRLLRRPRNPVACGLIAGLCVCLVGLTTLRARPSRDVGLALWHWQNPIYDLRRCLWYLNRSWLALPPRLADRGFDVTAGLDDTQLETLHEFLARDTSRLGAQDRALLTARQFTKAPSDPRQKQDFKTEVDALLATVSLPQKGTRIDRPNASKQGLTRRDATQALADLSVMFSDIHLPWFVISGTFLGLIREGGFLAHDYDIDVGVAAQDVSIEALKERILKGTSCFALRKIDIHVPLDTSASSRPMLVKLLHRSGVPVDVFVHYDLGDGRVMHGSSLHHWFNSPFDLAPYVLEGTEVQGPADADRYLSENYGDWRTPVSVFDSSTHTPNLEIVRHPITLMIFLRRLLQLAEVQDQRAVTLANELIRQKLIQSRPEAPGFELCKGLF